MAQTKKALEQLEHYHTELQRSAEWRREFEPMWQECYDLYSHRHKFSTIDDENPDLDKLMVDLAFSLIRTQLAATAVSYPYITVEERKPQHHFAALVGEEAINHVWYREDFRDPIQDVWLDTLIIGHGWGKTGWRFGIEEMDRESQELEDEFMSIRATVDAVGRSGRVDVSELPSDDEIRQALEKRGFRILVDSPAFERVSPWDIYVDPHSVREEGLRWISQRVRLPLKFAQEQEHWDRKARDNLSALDSDGLGLYGEKAMRDRYRESAIEWVDVWEMWDIERGTVATFGSQGDRFLIEPQPMPYAHGHPFLMCRDNEVPDQFYPIGELESIKDQQYELNRIRSTQLDALKNQRRSYLIPQNLANHAPFRSAMEKNEPDTLIPVPNDLWEQYLDAKTPPMMPLPQGAVPADLYAMSGVVMDDALMIAGATDYFLGGAPESRTATEAAVANSGQQSRDQFKRDAIEAFVQWVARNTFQNMQTFMQTQDYVKVSGRQVGLGVEQGQFLGFDRYSIAGEFDFKVEAGSMAPLNPQERMERAMQVMTAIAPILPAVPNFNYEALIRQFLEAAGIKNVDQFFVSGQGNPLQAQLGQEGGAAPGGPGPSVPGSPSPLGGGFQNGLNPSPSIQTTQLENQVGLSL